MTKEVRNKIIKSKTNISSSVYRHVLIRLSDELATCSFNWYYILYLRVWSWQKKKIKINIERHILYGLNVILVYENKFKTTCHHHGETAPSERPWGAARIHAEYDKHTSETAERANPRETRSRGPGLGPVQIFIHVRSNVRTCAYAKPSPLAVKVYEHTNAR